MSRLNGIYPDIERSDWHDKCVEFHLSEGRRIDVTLEADGSLTIHGSGWGGGSLILEPRVSNEISVRLRDL